MPLAPDWMLLISTLALVPYLHIIFNTVHSISDINNTCINFTTFEEYLRELEYAQTDGQTERQTNQMHKHFSTLSENVNNVRLNA